MPLTITTLNNEAAAAKTFEQIFSDRVSSEWLNTTDSTATFDSRLTVKQSVLGKTKDGNVIRRSLVQVKLSAPVVGVTPPRNEEIIVNMTITTPVSFTSSLTSTMRKDAVAFVRNLVTGANVDKLVQGMV